jgi:hypothetical protein
MNEEVESSNEITTSRITENSSPVLSAFCGSLRSKKFFMRDSLATEESDYLDASNYCWCRETHQVIGPDGGRVQPSRCVSSRSCYTSALDSN